MAADALTTRPSSSPSKPRAEQRPFMQMLMKRASRRRRLAAVSAKKSLMPYRVMRKTGASFFRQLMRSALIEGSPRKNRPAHVAGVILAPDHPADRATQAPGNISLEANSPR